MYYAPREFCQVIKHGSLLLEGGLGCGNIRSPLVGWEHNYELGSVLFSIFLNQNLFICLSLKLESNVKK